MKTVSVGGGRHLDGGYTCAIDEEAQLFCWLRGSAPRRMRAIRDVEAVGVSQGHICALKTGVPHCLSIRTFRDDREHSRFRPQTGAPPLEHLAVDERGHCGTTKDGRVFCWGHLCPAGTSWRRTFSPCEISTGRGEVEGLSAYWLNFCVARNNGTTCWPYARHFSLVRPVEHRGRYVDIAVGERHSCGLDAQGAVFCWGLTFQGQAGRKPWKERRIRVPVTGRAAISPMMYCWLVQGSGVRCWSAEGYPRAINPPLRGELLSGTEDATSLAVFAGELCVTRADALPRCTRNTELSVDRLRGATQLHMDNDLTLAVTADRGLVWVDGDALTVVPDVEADGPLSSVTQVDKGTFDSCAITKGRVACFRPSFQRVESMRYQPGLTDVTHLAQFDRGGCALTRGAVYCWGDGAFGEVGDGSFRRREQPVQVEGLPPITSLAAGSRHVCAVDGAGHTWCWGRNTYGELGDGTLRNAGRPQRVPDLEGARSVVATDGATCVVREADAVCWGHYAADDLLGREDSDHVVTEPHRIDIGPPPPPAEPPPLEEATMVDGKR